MHITFRHLILTLSLLLASLASSHAQAPAAIESQTPAPLIPLEPEVENPDII